MSWIIRLAIETLYATLRVEYKGLTTIPPKHIIALWHNQLAVGPLLIKRFSKVPFSIVVSKSRDGLLLGSFLETFSGVEIIQVGHKNRHTALSQIIGALEKDRVLMITPDGPRGPMYVVKPGVHFSSEQASAPIIVMQWQASKVFTFNTWDKLTLPYPFSKVSVTLKEPITFSDSSPDELIKALA